MAGFLAEEASSFLHTALSLLRSEFSDLGSSVLGLTCGTLSLRKEIESLIGVIELLCCSVEFLAGFKIVQVNLLYL